MVWQVKDVAFCVLVGFVSRHKVWIPTFLLLSWHMKTVSSTEYEQILRLHCLACPNFQRIRQTFRKNSDFIRTKCFSVRLQDIPERLSSVMEARFFFPLYYSLDRDTAIDLSIQGHCTTGGGSHCMVECSCGTLRTQAGISGVTPCLVSWYTLHLQIGVFPDVWTCSMFPITVLTQTLVHLYVLREKSDTQTFCPEAWD